jgi:hypothetical protein
MHAVGTVEEVVERQLEQLADSLDRPGSSSSGWNTVV